MKDIEFNQYEKISDVVYFLGQNVVLKFNVKLGYKKMDGTKSPLHTEYKYNSKYNNQSESYSINRNFDYYLSIETIGGKSEKEFIMIYPKDMLYLKMCLNQAFSWFTDNDYKELYKFKNDKLILCKKIEPLYVKGLAMNKYISFEPTVCHLNNIDQMGVRIHLTMFYVDIPVDVLSGLLYTLSDFNMYLAAQNMINYLQRPIHYGYNLVDFKNEDYIKDYNPDGFIESNTNRQIKSKKSQKSFFSKVDDM